LQPDTVWICLGILALITLINLRGVREAGLFFMIPTYLFLATLLIAIAIGITKTILAGGQPVPIVAPPRLPLIGVAPTTWLLLKVFASGCTAMTGVEAVSNGTKAFREPVVQTARRALTIIIALLIVLLAGIAFLVRAYGIAATDPGAPGYQSVLSMLLLAVAGRGIFYNVSIASILLVLALSANTAFADFPRLCRAIARNNYLPHTFATRGRRLVYTYGISVLAALSALLLILFGGVTDRLIPLYAVGAFLAFTLSQAGMVAHWRRVGGKGSTRYMIVNGVGATATGITVLVVLAAKFLQGAWMTALLIPVLLITMGMVRRHYHRVAMETRSTTPLEFTRLAAPIVILPVHDWSAVTKKAVAFAFDISKEVRAVHVDDGAGSANLIEEWKRFVQDPAEQAGIAAPPLKIVSSRYRFVIRPIVEYVLEVEQANPDRQIAVLVPELVERHWYHHLLHNKRASLLKAVLLLKGNQRIIVVNVPWYLET
jgi:Amino acid permease